MYAHYAHKREEPDIEVLGITGEANRTGVERLRLEGEA